MSASVPAPSLLVSTHDARRLEALLARAASPATEALENELLRAELVEPFDMPCDVVTMNSQLVCTDDAGHEHHVRLVYPQDADASEHKVSVLAPLGSALLGLRVGSAIARPLPNGRTTMVRVTKVTYQPEAHGQLD